MSGDSLPVNWEEWKLSDVGDWFGGGTPSKSEERFWNGSIPWVSPKDMKVTSILDTEDHISLDAVASSAAKIIPPGAVLFVTRSGILAHSFPVSTTRTNVTINQDLKAIVPFQPIDPEYLSWCLRAHARSILDRCTKDGTTVHSIEAPALKAYRVPIAPIEEQRRIVAKVEALFPELDQGIESLKTAREQLKIYRQAVLKQAFEGKLTAKWREENRDELETPDQIRSRIQEERDGHCKKQVAVWKNAVETWEVSGREGKKPPQPRTPKEVSALPGEVRAILPNLPEGWTWEKLGWMTCGTEYGTAAKSSEAGLVPVIRMGNLQNGALDWSNLAFTSDQAEIDNYTLKPGDVLFNRTNSPELVGKTAIYRGERPALFAGYLIRVNQIETVANGQYLNLFLNSHIAKQHGNNVKTDGVNQSNINGEKLQGYPFPYCSIAEQNEVVRIVDEKISLTDRLIRDIDAELCRSDALRQSILKKAFSGQLVPQDPDDEPASVLLERIRMEKDAKSETNKHKCKPQPCGNRVASA